MILLHGFIKKTQKTPDDDLSLARKRFKEIDPSHSGVTLETLARAAQVLGRHIRVELV
jgi:hypothetical protein